MLVGLWGRAAYCRAHAWLRNSLCGTVWIKGQSQCVGGDGRCVEGDCSCVLGADAIVCLALADSVFGVLRWSENRCGVGRYRLRGL